MMSLSTMNRFFLSRWYSSQSGPHGSLSVRFVLTALYTGSSTAASWILSLVTALGLLLMWPVVGVGVVVAVVVGGG